MQHQQQIRQISQMDKAYVVQFSVKYLEYTLELVLSQTDLLSSLF